jgi:voltage-gated potassium channel
MNRAPETKSFRRRLFEVLEISAIDDKVATAVDGFMIVLIVLNVAVVMFETSQPIFREYRELFRAFDIFTVVCFTAEYLARVWVSDLHVQYPRNKPWRARLRYMTTPYAIIDLVAILPFFLGFLWDLRILRVFRLVRLLKLFRYSPALATLGRVLHSERRALMAAGVIMMGLMVFSATIMYYLEHDAQPDVFASVPHAMWWAAVTLTTIGYGDMAPVTTPGRMFGGVVAVMGLGMFALPVGIIASGFANEIRQRDFNVSKDLLGRVPVFAQLEATPLNQVALLLKARIFSPADVIVRAGDHADCMFFILSGEVEAVSGAKRTRLHAGDFFGEVGLLTEQRRTFTATAHSRCQLMVLQKTDFLHMISEHPEVGRTILNLALERLDIVNQRDGTQLHERDVARTRRAIERALQRLEPELPAP